MNTTKFRGKSLSTVEWVYGYYYATPLHFLDKPDVITHCIIDTEGSIYKVDPTTVGQYIGVKDKNDTEMYVGDKIEHEDGRISVVECDLPHFILRHSDGSSDFIAKRNVFKIIGSIHDNPDLLTQ